MKKIIFLLVFVFLPFIFCDLINAIATKEVFAKYVNPCLVESGSYLGDGIQMALDTGYPVVHSIDLSQKYYAISKARFANQKNVHVWQGDSGKILGRIIHDIKVPSTFWLDGHCSMGDTAMGETMTPIWAELCWIEQHPIKTHTILIDDIRCAGGVYFDYLTLDQLIAKLKEINPKYTITFEDGYVPNDILVAYIAK